MYQVIINYITVFFDHLKRRPISVSKVAIGDLVLCFSDSSVGAFMAFITEISCIFA